MKLVTFETDGRSAVGLLNAAGTAVHPVPGCADMQALIGIWPVLDTAAVLRSAALPLEQVRLLAPIPRPVQDVICLGINYFDHAKESESRRRQGRQGTGYVPNLFFQARG
ncbi:MAG: Rv2993c-like domain-containing protein [Oscillospiraceae bacterium]